MVRLASCQLHETRHPCPRCGHKGMRTHDARQQLNQPRPGVASCPAELRHHERAQRASPNLGPDPQEAHVRHQLDLIDFGLAATPWPEVFGKCRSLPEAAHVPSEYLTEPMRRRCRRPRLAPLSMRRSLACPLRPGPRRWQRSPLADRARRFAWPARGTERFLGRRGVQSARAVVVWEQTSARPRIAVWCRLGPIFLPSLLRGRGAGGEGSSGTPNQEPSRRRSSRTLDVFAKRC